jgi:antitoxin component of MazEF toxin-antitoxin module
MLLIRRLTRKGNSFHVSMPTAVIDFMRWRIGDGIALEVTDSDRIVLRRVKASDMLVATVPPMNMDLTAPGAK